MAAASSAPQEALLIEGPGGAARPQSIDPGALCSTNELSGFRVLRPLGVVRGVTVRSRNIGADIGAGFKSMCGGEIRTMTTLCEGAREQALQRMCEHAAERGATGIVAVRYDANSITPGITEVIAYGTAVTDGGVPAAVPAAGGAAEGHNFPPGAACTSNGLPGYSVQRSLGVVHGLTVRSRNVFANIGAGLKSIAGGEIKAFTKMCEDARQQAYDRMAAAAAELGADGLLAVRYETNQVTEGITEVLAYGTAVSSLAGEAREAAADHGAAAGPSVTTSNVLPGLPEQHSLGIVQGIAVRSSNFVANVGASFRALAGGEIKTWSKLCEATRRKALERMLEQAQQRGAKGVVAMRFDSNEVAQGIVEVIAYGTAVSDRPPPQLPAAGEGVDRHLVSTDVQVPGFAGQCSLGVARGISVQSCHFIRNIGAGLKSIVGGEIRNFHAVCERARAEAFERMLEHAAEMGATGVAGMRYESNDIRPGVIEVVAFGTVISDGARMPRAAPAAPASASASASAPGAAALDRVLVSSTDAVLGRGLPRSLGVARGVTVRSRNIGASIGAGLKATFVGGEVRTWTRLCDDAREQAFQRLLRDAADKGATGVTAMRFETNEIAPGMTEVLAYGTAVA